MQKAKCGISVGLLGAAIYFMGLVNTIPLILLAGYVLLVEQNEWLRKTAVKAVVLVLAAALVPAVLGLVGYVFDLVNAVFGWVHLNLHLGFPFDLDQIIKNVVWFVRDAMLLLCGFSALSQGSIKAGPIDKLVDKHLQ